MNTRLSATLAAADAVGSRVKGVSLSQGWRNWAPSTKPRNFHISTRPEIGKTHKRCCLKDIHRKDQMEEGCVLDPTLVNVKSSIHEISNEKQPHWEQTAELECFLDPVDPPLI